MNYIIHVVDETSFYREKDDIFGRETIRDEEERSLGDTMVSDAFYLSSTESTDPIDAVISTANIIKIEDSDGEQVSLSEIIAKSKGKEEDEEYMNILRVTSTSDYYDQATSALFSHFFFLTKQDDEGTYYECHRVSFFAIEEGKIMKVIEKDSEDV